MLSFLNASILSVLIAAVLPLLIHLFIKKKPKMQIFSSLMFIKLSQNVQKSKTSFNNLLLLIIRILIIATFVLALAKPAIKSSFFKSKNHPKTAIAVIVDNSITMDYWHDTENDLQKAIKIAKKINSKLTTDDAIAVFCLDESFNSFNSGLNYGKINENIFNKIKISPNPASLIKVLKQADEVLKNSQYANTEIYFLTDFNEKKFDYIPESKCFFIKVNEYKNKSNLSIESVDIKNNNNKKDFVFELVNYSNLPKTAIVKLILNKNTKAIKSFELKPKQSRFCNLSFEAENNKSYTGFLQVEDELLPFDNKRFLAFKNTHSQNIALVSKQNVPVSISAACNVFTGSQGKILTKNIQGKTPVVYYGLQSVSGKLANTIQNASSNVFYLSQKPSPKYLKYLEDLFDIKFNGYIKQALNLDYVHAFSGLTQEFKNTKNASITGLHTINNKNSDILLSASNKPVLIQKNKNFLWLTPANMLSNPFWLESIYPAIAVKILGFSAFSNQSKAVTGKKILINDNSITMPNNEELKLATNSFIPNKSGIYKVKNNFLVANIASRQGFFKPYASLNKKIIVPKNYEEQILQSKHGYEFWKWLFFACFMLLVFEIIVVKYIKNKSEVN